MGKLGKISTIKKEYNSAGMQTMQGGLSQRGLSRIPGTGVFKYPYKELDGRYRTGLDADAAYKNIKMELKELKRVRKSIKKDKDL